MIDINLAHDSVMYKAFRLYKINFVFYIPYNCQKLIKVDLTSVTRAAVCELFFNKFDRYAMLHRFHLCAVGLYIKRRAYEWLRINNP